ncbi:MAG: hypothetical protein LC122_14125 [Chitinophagales bacterium]|nr:hypothetical protein [Chitinophagales bacterium]
MKKIYIVNEYSAEDTIEDQITPNYIFFSEEAAFNQAYLIIKDLLDETLKSTLYDNFDVIEQIAELDNNIKVAAKMENYSKVIELWNDYANKLPMYRSFVFVIKKEVQ